MKTEKQKYMEKLKNFPEERKEFLPDIDDYDNRLIYKYLGKFEKEHIAAEYYYNFSLIGDGEILFTYEGLDTIIGFEVDKPEQCLFDTRKTKGCLTITETGFVYFEFLTKREYKKIDKECQRDMETIDSRLN